MRPFLSETPEERRKERDETFCIRMIELSILTTTLCGILISFSYEATPVGIFFFLFSTSFFVACGTGFIIIILVGRGKFVKTVLTDIIERLIIVPIIVFLAGMLIFLLGIAYMAAVNWIFYLIVWLPILITMISMMYILRRYESS